MYNFPHSLFFSCASHVHHRVSCLPKNIWHADRKDQTTNLRSGGLIIGHSEVSRNLFSWVSGWLLVSYLVLRKFWEAYLESFEQGQKYYWNNSKKKFQSQINTFKQANTWHILKQVTSSNKRHQSSQYQTTLSSICSFIFLLSCLPTFRCQSVNHASAHVDMSPVINETNKKKRQAENKYQAHNAWELLRNIT